MASMDEAVGNDNGQPGTASLMGQFQRALDAELGPEATFAAREKAGLALANRLCQTDQRRDLSRRSARYECPEVEVEGKRYRRHERGQVTYHGLCGPLAVERYSYREIGTHNGPTVVPLELDAGLMERATPALGYALAEGYALSHSRELEKRMDGAHRDLPSRSTTERIAKELAGSMKESCARIVAVVRADERLPEGTHAIAIGLDRTSVPMQEARDPSKPQGPRHKRTGPYQRKIPDPVDVNYRMAYVGTVSFVDAHGEALLTRRYGAAAHEEPEELVAQMMADVRHAHALDPTLRVGILQDGAKELWSLVREALAREPSIQRVGIAFEAIDRHHLLERLSEALLLAGFTPAYREQKRHAWNQALDARNRAIDDIEREVIKLHAGCTGKARAKIYEHCTYIENNKDRMRYATLRKVGLPVGSGPTEGACKSLVQVRAKGCGQRWLHEGIEAVLTLRALEMSDRLRPAFEELAKDYTAIIKRAA